MHTLVASVVIRAGDDVLLVEEGKEPVRGTWNLPGGRVESNEEPTRTAVREVGEEVGADVNLLGFVGAYIGKDAFVDGPFIAVTYRGELSGDPRTVPTDTVEAVEWVDPNDFDELPLRSPYVRRAVSDAGERTLPLDVVRSVVE